MGHQKTWQPDMLWEPLYIGAKTSSCHSIEKLGEEYGVLTRWGDLEAGKSSGMSQPQLTSWLNAVVCNFSYKHTEESHSIDPINSGSWESINNYCSKAKYLGWILHCTWELKVLSFNLLHSIYSRHQNYIPDHLIVAHFLSVYLHDPKLYHCMYLQCL